MRITELSKRVEVDQVREDLTRVRKDLTTAGRTVWLAGLGALAQVEEEGRELFDDLVERGRKLEVRQFKALDRTVAKSSDTVKEWSDRVQHTVEDGMRGVLHRVGLPSRDDLGRLSTRLDTLSKKVDRLGATRN